MSVTTFTAGTTVLVVALGAAVLAMWLVVRFPDLGPSSLSRAFVHLALAFAVGYLVGPAMQTAQRASLPVSISILVVALPALGYMFLAALWLIRSLQQLADSHRFR